MIGRRLALCAVFLSLIFAVTACWATPGFPTPGSATAAPVGTPNSTGAATPVPASTGVATPVASASPVGTVQSVTGTPTVVRQCVALDAQFQSIGAQARAARDIFPDPLVATCPVSPAASVPGAILALRKPSSDPAVPGAINYMIWRGDTKTIYVLKRDNSVAPTFRVSAYPDTWVEGDPTVLPECATIAPPADAAAANPSEALQVPIRGFGKVWCQQKLQDSIGFGMGKEVGASAAVQETQGGLYLAIKPGEGPKTETLFLLDLKNGVALGR